MYLVIGGLAQGKLDWVKEHFNIEDYQLVDGASLNIEDKKIDFANRIVLYNLHELLRNSIYQGCSENIVTQLLDLPPNTIIICNEIGSGLVPLEAFERQWRDLVGRTCCRLAEEADEVWRIFCGLPQRIK